MSSDRVWINSNGGPLIVVPQALLPDWSGVDVPPYRVIEATIRWSNKEDRASDYDRACDVNDYVETIPVGYGEGLILGDAPLETTWIPQDWGGMLARWEYAENDSSMELVLDSVPSSLEWEAKDTFVVASSPLELFNSAEPGMEPLSRRLVIDLVPASYDIWWTRYVPNDSTAVMLIALRRRAA